MYAVGILIGAECDEFVRDLPEMGSQATQESDGEHGILSYMRN